MEGIDKTVVSICGVPMILRTVRAMAASERITQIVIVTREDLIDTVRELCSGEEKLHAVVPGGSSRTQSVLRGLQATSCELVAIHDGARPFVTVSVIDETISAAQVCGAAAPAVPVKDTIKVAENNRVSSTPDRSVLYAVETPQVFPKETIERCLLVATEKGIPLTDDCSAAEAAGLSVILTRGNHENLKITTPVDLAFAKAIVEGREGL